MKKIILFILLTVSTNVFSELSVLKYDNMSKAEKDNYIMYIMGLGVSTKWMTAFEAVRNKSNKEYKNLFCEPNKLGLNGSNYIDILEIRINKIKSLNYDLDKTHIEVEMINGLIDTFPCKK